MTARYIRRGWIAALLALCAVLLAACDREPTIIPTRIPSIEGLATADYLTAIAPPEGMRERVNFPRIDDNLVFVSGWHSQAAFRFEGNFAGTPRPASAETTLSTWYHQTGNQRRVVVQGVGDLFGEDAIPRREAVRLGGQTFLLLDGECYGAADGDAALLADLRVGDVLGGVNLAIPAGEQRVLHGQQVWRYHFAPDALDVPLVRLMDGGAITAVQGELWVARVAPNQNVVVRYYLNIAVENAVLRLFEASPPVSGVIQLRYDLYDVGINPNITPPHGC